jgi:uncharacterized phiE125 gp8 family phage protein
MSDIVSTSATTDPITLADAKRHLNVSTTADDTYIGNLITAAAAYCQDMTNRRFINETRTLKMRTFEDMRYVHDRVIDLPKSPLSSVSSITYVDTAGTTQTLSTTAYITSQAGTPGQISESYNNTWPATRNVADDVVVTYVAGYGSTQSAVPDNAKHAVRMTVAHWYRNREAVEIGQVSAEVEHGLTCLLGVEDFPSYG